MLYRKRLPAALMRGGTSKGLVFRAADLPPFGASRDAAILAAMGPDASGLSIDGVGGGATSTLKVHQQAIIQTQSAGNRPTCPVGT